MRDRAQQRLGSEGSLAGCVTRWDLARRKRRSAFVMVKVRGRKRRRAVMVNHALPRRRAVALLVVAVSLLLLLLARVAVAQQNGDSFVANVGSVLLPAYFYNVINGSETLTSQVERKTVDGMPCHFPVVVRDRFVYDCISWWDGQEW